MYLFSNSMKNLLRNKGRNTLLFLILLVTITAVTTCAIIQQAAKQQVDECIASFKPAVSMQTDYDKLAEDYPSKEVTNMDGSTYWEAGDMPDYAPSVEMIQKWSNSELVDHTELWVESEYCSAYNSFQSETMFGDVDVSEYYGKDVEYFCQLALSDYEAKKAYYLSELFVSSSLYDRLYDDGHAVTEEEASELAAITVFGENHYQEFLENGISDELADVALGIKLGYSDVMDGFINQTAPTGGIWGYSDFEFDESFFSQKIVSLKEGNYPYNLNECLVSEKFAEMNGLKVGDTLHITSSYDADMDVELELKISGLFGASYFDATADSGADSFVNQIFTSAETLQHSGFTYFHPIDPTFYLSSIDDVDNFKKMLTDDGLSKYINLTDNEKELDSMIESFKKTGNFATILMIITLVLGGSVFLLLSFLAVGERKYEIGVLRSIGMKKNKIIRGFLYETACIVIACCVIGITLGTVISQPVADIMLSQNEDTSDINIEYSPYDSYVEGDDGMVINPVEDSDVKNDTASKDIAFQTKLSWSSLLIIIGAAFILMVSAVTVAGCFITKFEPNKILADQE